jgi:Fe-S-cluster containining protein
MTAAEAAALECNRCGDCCGSREVESAWPDEGVRWGWGAIPADGFAEFNGGAPLIIPLAEVTPGYYEDTFAVLSGHHPFRCARFSRDDEGLGVCGLHDAPRPALCGEFPFDRMDDPERFAKSIAFFPRCTWYGIEIVEGCRGGRSTGPPTFPQLRTLG